MRVRKYLKIHLNTFLKDGYYRALKNKCNKYMQLNFKK